LHLQEELKFNSITCKNLYCEGNLYCKGLFYGHGDLYCKGNLRYKGNSNCNGNLHCEGDLYCKGYLDCKGNLDCRGNLDCKYLTIKKFSKWDITVSIKNIKIGYETKSIKEWKVFFKNNQSYETKSIKERIVFFENNQSYETTVSTEEYKLIKLAFKDALIWAKYLKIKKSK